MKDIGKREYVENMRRYVTEVRIEVQAEIITHETILAMQTSSVLLE